MKSIFVRLGALQAWLGASFRRKALCIALPGLVIVSAVHTIDAVRTERMIVRKEIRQRAEVIAHLASRIGELPLISENPELIRTAMSSLRSVQGITFVAFYNRDLVLIEKDEEKVPAVRESCMNPEICTSEFPGYFDIYAPVFINRVRDDISIFSDSPFENGVKESAGWVRFGFSKSGVIRQEREIIFRGMGLAIVFSFLASLVTYLMFTMVTRSLDTVSRALRGMRKGEYPELQASSSDEIGMIATEFNKMSNAVRDRETRLMESEVRIRTLFDRVEHAIFRIDREGRIIESNDKFLALCGSSPQFGFLLDRLKHEKGQLPEVMKNAEEQIVGAEGEEFTVLMSLYPELDARGNIASYDGYFVDITEKKKLEKGLIRTQKLESIGLLAGGIAHDFNNILGIIIGYTDMALSQFKEHPELAPLLRQVLEAGFRAKDLVKQILAFSRQTDQSKEPVQMSILVKEVLKMLRATLPTTIEIKHEMVSRAVVMANPTQIHQVLMNLCTNANHAMSDTGGILEVNLRDANLTEDLVRPLGLDPGVYVQLTVNDTGQGIEQAILDKIFDPFFTTKEKGKGTGLGLSVVHGIVKSHGGAIRVESSLGKGSTFHVFLPATQSEPGQAVLDAVAVPFGRGERILVVDDEPQLARITKQMLDYLGYGVDFRTNCIEALEHFRDQLKTKPYDLVITDMTMPHLTGADFAAELFSNDPNIRIILSTGFSEKINMEKAKSLGIQGFLTKPVVMKELAVMVRKVLDERKVR